MPLDFITVPGFFDRYPAIPELAMEVYSWQVHGTIHGNFPASHVWLPKGSHSVLENPPVLQIHQ